VDEEKRGIYKKKGNEKTPCIFKVGAHDVWVNTIGRSTDSLSVRVSVADKRIDLNSRRDKTASTVRTSSRCAGDFDVRRGTLART